MADYNLRSKRRRSRKPSQPDLFDPQSFRGNGGYDGIKDSDDSEDSTGFFNPESGSEDEEYEEEYEEVDESSSCSEASPPEPSSRGRKRPRSPSSEDLDEIRGPVIPIGNRLFEVLANGDSEEEYNPDDSWKEGLDEEEIKRIEPQLMEVRENISKNNPTIPAILQSGMTQFEKETAIQMYDILQNMDPNTSEYVVMRRELIEIIRTSQVATPENNRRRLRRRKNPPEDRRSQELNEELTVLRKKMELNIPTLNKILSAQLPQSDKIRGLQLYDQLHQVPYGSQEWYDIQTTIQNMLKLALSTKEEVQLIETQEEKCEKRSFNYNLDLRMKILALDVSDEIKTQIYDIYLIWSSTRPDDGSYSTLREKLNWFVQLPYRRKMIPRNIDDPRQYCLEIYENLNKELYGMKDAKERLIQVLNNRIYGDNSRSIIAFKGKPGVGKTKLARSLAKAVGLPFDKISLGGAIDSTIFRGSDSVWIGSSPSAIIQALARTKYANPIILLDEIDKLVSERGGFDVQSSLLHVLDYTQNKEFKDAYLREFVHDISNVWFIVTMNDDSELDSALKDRLDIIEVPSYTQAELKEIIKRHTLPDALSSIGLTNEQIIFTEEAYDRLLQILSADIELTGVRPIEKAINTIVSRINLYRSIQQGDLQLTFNVPHFNGFPYTVTDKNIDSIYPQPSKNLSYSHMYL